MSIPPQTQGLSTAELMLMSKKPYSQDDEKISKKEYLKFFVDQYDRMQLKFPRRNEQEISKIVQLQWELRKMQIKTQEHLLDARLIQKQSSQLVIPSYEIQQKPQQDIKISHKSQKIAKQKLQSYYPKQTNGFVVIDGQSIPVPQKPDGQFTRFYTARNAEIRLNNPTLTSNETMQMISIQWKSMSDEEKLEWSKGYIQDMETYYQQKKQFSDKYGFFPSYFTKEEKMRLSQYKIYVEEQSKREEGKNQKIQSHNQNTQDTLNKSHNTENLVKRFWNSYQNDDDDITLKKIKTVNSQQPYKIPQVNEAKKLSTQNPLALLLKQQVNTFIVD